MSPWHAVKDLLRPRWHALRHGLSPPCRWPSETSKCRPRLERFCEGDGLDIGFGGDPISPAAIRMDLPEQYGTVGDHRVQLRGDAAHLRWFNDGVLDYVFSSHVLEDFDDTSAVLREWLRVIRPGGRLIIFCPDEQRFRAHCQRTGQPYNPHHVHSHFSVEYVKQLLGAIGGTRIVYENPDVDVYSWDLVVEKIR